ncbi:MAG TPA: M4 family metallopeptidase [Anaerolineales bacterium]|nr:M4 family metallopeptidase [Anaerolineales bacterium]
MCHQPINCIIPPHMLKNIAEKGSSYSSKKAVMTMVSTEQLRGRRIGIANVAKMFPSTIKGEGKKERIVYSAANGLTLPGLIIRKEGDPPVRDISANEAYDGCGDTWDLFHDIYQRDSVDDRGLKLESTVHYQESYDNAFWDGRQMVYGDGDEDMQPEERIFNRFTRSVEIIAHELTHGVSQNEANLTYWQDTGALNESISDVFGILVKQYKYKQTVLESDWIIGSRLFSENVSASGIRSMIEPGSAYDDPILGKDPQPGHLRDYVSTSSDNGGVHINSGIPNRAFSLAAIEIGGYAWEKTGLIWYKTLIGGLREDSQFQDAADLTAFFAGDLFGFGSLEQNAVVHAWKSVGLIPTLSKKPKENLPTNSDSPGCLLGLMSAISNFRTINKG